MEESHDDDDDGDDDDDDGDDTMGRGDFYSNGLLINSMMRTTMTMVCSDGVDGELCVAMDTSFATDNGRVTSTKYRTDKTAR